MNDEDTIESLKKERRYLSASIRRYCDDLEVASKSIARLREEDAVKSLLIRALTSRIQELERKG